MFFTKHESRPFNRVLRPSGGEKCTLGRRGSFLGDQAGNALSDPQGSTEHELEPGFWRNPELGSSRR